MDTTPDGERTIDASNVEDYGSYGGGNITPLNMTGKSLGGVDLKSSSGATQIGVKDGVGPNNVGILVKVSGSISGDGSGYFVVDDGELINDASNAQGIRVLCRGD